MPFGLRFFALSVFAVSIVTAQRSAPPPASHGNGPGIGTTPTAPSQPAGNQQDQWPGARIPIMLMGAVAVEGGGDPPSNIAIQRVCGNIPRTVARTDPKGQFSFQWNDFKDVTPDASDPGTSDRGGLMRSAGAGGTAATNPDQLPGSNMRGCELRADAPGFRSDRVELADHRALDNPDVGVIMLHRLSPVKGLSVSASTLDAPGDARKAWERGVQMLRSTQDSNPAAAAKEFEKALKIYPKYADAWLDLGRARERVRAEEGAREAFLKAIDVDNKRVEPFIELGMLASHRREWPDAAQFLDRALQLDPVHYPHLWYDDAEADYHVGNLDRAEKNVREALKIAGPSREPGALRLLTFVLISKQDYPGAETALQTYLREHPDIEDFAQLQEKLVEIHGHIPEKQ